MVARTKAQTTTREVFPAPSLNTRNDTDRIVTSMNFSQVDGFGTTSANGGSKANLKPSTAPQTTARPMTAY